MSVLDKQVVLKLNANWMRLGYCTPRQAIIAMTGEVEGGSPPALALDITLDENGDLLSAIPTKWEDWVKLPVRSQDLSISSHKEAIRCPVLLVCPAYAKMPLKAKKLTTRAILERDGLIDQYTGEKLTREQASVDHVIPKDRGGKNTWFNMVTCDKKRNHEKSNRLNREIGWRLIRKPVEPRAIPVSETITEVRHPHHAPFVK